MLWAVLAAMTAAVLALLLAPLLRRRGHGASRRDYDLALYRRQLAELEAEAARGLVDPAPAAEARREIERRLLSAADQPEAPAASARSWRAAVAWGLSLMLPAAAAGLYLGLGQPKLAGAPWLPPPPRQASPAAADAETVALVERLASHMRENPDDARGWRLLGRSYLPLGRFIEAADALSRAVALDPADLAGRVDLAEALTLAADGTVTPAARAGFEAALREAPESPRPRYYLGLAAWQSGRPQEAYDRWLALAREAPADAPWLPLLRQRLARAASELGIDLAKELPARPPDSTAATGPGISDIEAAARLSPDERQAFIREMVERLAARLARSPQDFEGWMRLGQARRVLGEAAAAAEAYARAAALRPQDPAPLAARASALIAAAPDDAPPPEVAIEAFRQVLRLDPQHAEALWFTGLADATAGKTQAAIAAWEQLLPLLEPDSPAHRALSEELARARGRGQ